MVTSKAPQHPITGNRQIVEISPYTITVSSASWGLNCLQLYNKKTGNNSYGNTQQNYKYEESSSGVNLDKIKDNNVIYNVSKLCNGKARCEIPINTDALGEDPLPNCVPKKLLIEYRCFAIDRMRTASSEYDSLIIDCDKLLERK